MNSSDFLLHEWTKQHDAKLCQPINLHQCPSVYSSYADPCVHPGHCFHCNEMGVECICIAGQTRQADAVCVVYS